MNQEPNISVYDAEGGVEDFPVLKAFQQYIDAEQAKARKRLLTVSIFFGVVLITVIIIFSIMVVNANDQNQSLNDRLVEYAMEVADRKAEAAKSSAIQEATVRSMNETLQKLQRQLEEQERKATAAAADAARELAAAKSQIATRLDPEFERRQTEANAKLQRAIALLKAEKEKLAQEKARFHEEELERYRRENYPEYYEKQTPSRVKGKAYFTDDELDGDDKELPASKTDDKTNPEAELDEDQAIEYFKDDTYTIPVEVKGKSAGWRVPLD